MSLGAAVSCTLLAGSSFMLMAGRLQSTESNHWAFSSLNGGLWDQHVGAHFGVTASNHLSNQPHHSHPAPPCGSCGPAGSGFVGERPYLRDHAVCL